jgi:hypothetical protein
MRYSFHYVLIRAVILVPPELYGIYAIAMIGSLQKKPVPT